MDWKERQHIYHQCFKHDDLIELMDVRFDESPHNITERVCALFYDAGETTIYPYKSYFVAVVYASCLAQWFGGTPISHLCRQDLLYNNDPCFVPYNENPVIYDGIFEHLRNNNYNVLKEQRGLTPIVRGYCMREFLMEETND